MLEQPRSPWYRRVLVLDLAIAAVVVGVVVAAAVVWSRSERTVSPATVTGVTVDPAEPGSTGATLSATTGPQATAARPQPGVLWQKTGSGVHTGTPFVAPRNWRIIWSFDCQSFAGYGGGNFKISSAGAFNVGVQHTAVKKSGTYRVTAGGLGHLVVESVCERWTVKAVAP